LRATPSPEPSPEPSRSEAKPAADSAIAERCLPVVGAFMPWKQTPHRAVAERRLPVRETITDWALAKAQRRKEENRLLHLDSVPSVHSSISCFSPAWQRLRKRLRPVGPFSEARPGKASTFSPFAVLTLKFVVVCVDFSSSQSGEFADVCAARRGIRRSHTKTRRRRGGEDGY
jgi:hypothetical protein